MPYIPQGSVLLLESSRATVAIWGPLGTEILEQGRQSFRLMSDAIHMTNRPLRKGLRERNKDAISLHEFNILHMSFPDTDEHPFVQAPLTQPNSQHFSKTERYPTTAYPLPLALPTLGSSATPHQNSPTVARFLPLNLPSRSQLPRPLGPPACKPPSSVS